MRILISGETTLTSIQSVNEAITASGWDVTEVLTRNDLSVAKLVSAWSAAHGVPARQIRTNNPLSFRSQVDAVITLCASKDSVEQETECLAAVSRTPVYVQEVLRGEPILCEPWKFTQEVIRALNRQGTRIALQCWHDREDDEGGDWLYYEWTPYWPSCEGQAFTIQEEEFDDGRYVYISDESMNNFGGIATGQTWCLKLEDVTNQAEKVAHDFSTLAARYGDMEPGLFPPKIIQLPGT